MRPFLLALALSLPAIALPLSAPCAQPVTETLRAMLGHLPDPTGLEGAQIEFGDMALARSDAAGADPTHAQLRGLMRGDLTMRLTDPATAWRETVGFGLSDIAQLVGLYAPPRNASVLRLNAGAGAAVAQALEATGYSLQTERGVTAWARGEDNQIDIPNRNHDDPFGAGMGMSARVQIDGDLLRHARTWEMSLALAHAASRPVTARPDIAALLDALDQSMPTSWAGFPRAGLILATLFPDASGMGLPDPFDVITADVPRLPDAGPVWISALFADLSMGDRATGVLALSVALPDAEAAEALRARIEAAWAGRPSEIARRSFAEIIGAEASVTTYEAGGGLWVIIIAVEVDVDAYTRHQIPRNRAFNLLIDAAMARDLVFLAP